ncbi:MAG: hypothetical protein WC683_04610 [bacterium]
MASEQPLFEITCIAGADLRLNQYHAVKLSGNHTVVLCGDGEKPVGILQNKPNTGEWANVMVEGKSKAVLGEDLLAGASWASDTNGHLVTPGATDWVGGQLLDGGALSATPTNAELVTVLVGCNNPWREGR